MAHTIESLLGETVQRPCGQEVSVRSLCGKERIVGFYFTASWSPPCRMFTPILTSFYESLRGESRPSGAGNDHLEIVQISWDRDEASFREAAGAAPWLSLPFQDRDRQRKLSRKFGVHGIPRLVLLDGETGRVITRDGFDRLQEDVRGSAFPWRRKPLSDVIKGTLLQAVEGSETPENVEASAVLENHKIVGFYFSAQWCGPCRYFDPELVRAYTALRKQGQSFQVIMISADRSEESFQRHVAGVPWPTVPFEDPRNQTIKTHLGVDGIPMLVLVDSATGVTITMQGRQALTQDPQCLEFPWHPKPIEDLIPLVSVAINERACVILFTDGTDGGLEQGRSVLTAAANKEIEKGEVRDLLFFIAGEDEFSENVRDFADLDDTCPLLVILDSPEQNVYVCPEVKLSPQIASQFVDSFLQGELTPTPIPPMLADESEAERVPESQAAAVV
ncbi:nucleoredoxin-like [Plakobranchus ocellatus]|uniref:Nucleoredoxin-like n=1 Tax=Plakobranchus ocellatus TaxID=259542 RepID=A0AAV4DGC9_9GAST|nr:nucleoredoxin-like [Plakobranchus ocellatus]